MKFTSTAGMEHTPSTVMVFQTPDYSKFNLIKGNRELDMNKIKRIQADIDRGTNLLKYCPIVVVEKNKKLDIIDGQHRFVVAKKIKSPVFYVLADPLSLYDIARMNSNTEKWKSRDFINCYVELGNEHYKKLQSFLVKYPGVPITTCVSLLEKGKIAAGGSGMEAFQRGEFKVHFERDAHKVCAAAAQFNHSQKFSRAFITAVNKILDADVFPIDELIKKVNNDPDYLHQHDHFKKYLTNLEEIAGKGKHKRVAIY